MSKIGVEVTTTIRSGPSNDGPVSGRFQIAGITTGGPTDRAVLIRSIADYETVFGGRAAFSANAYDSARTYFEEGGSELIVSRVVGPAASKDTLTLQDASSVATLRVEARNPGAHLPPLKVSVATANGSSTITVTQAGEKVGIFTGSTPADLVVAAAKSPVVRVTDLGSATVAPSNLPANIAETDLAGGTDDRASITTQHVIAALNLAGEVGEGGVVATPGYPASVIATSLIAYAAANGRIALIAPESNLTAEAVMALVPDYLSGAGDYAGIAFPPVNIPDGSGSRAISPEAYAAAARARAHAETGFWRKPIGDIAQARWIIGTTVPVNTALNNRLNDAQVNGIVTTGNKVRLYGWTSLSTNAEMLSLTARDVLNNLGRDIKALLEPYVGQTIDGNGHLAARVESEVTGYLSPIADAGGFFARVVDDEELDPGYQVIVSEVNNPLAVLNQNILNVQVLVRLSPTADLIKVEIVKVPLQGTF